MRLATLLFCFACGAPPASSPGGDPTLTGEPAVDSHVEEPTPSTPGEPYAPMDTAAPETGGDG